MLSEEPCRAPRTCAAAAATSPLVVRADFASVASIMATRRRVCSVCAANFRAGDRLINVDVLVVTMAGRSAVEAD